MPANYLTKPQQHPDELREFVAFLKEQKIRSFLEIGSKFGGALWEIAKIMHQGARIVSVDLPNSHWGRTESQVSLEECIRHLRRNGYDAHLVLGDSTRADVIETVRKFSPYDAIFIDANHTEPYVRADFANYGRLARIICFHDVGWNNPTPAGRLAIEVPKVWADLRVRYAGLASFSEIRRDHGHNGIGIMQWH